MLSHVGIARKIFRKVEATGWHHELVTGANGCSCVWETVSTTLSSFVLLADDSGQPTNGWLPSGAWLRFAEKAFGVRGGDCIYCWNVAKPLADFSGASSFWKKIVTLESHFNVKQELLNDGTNRGTSIAANIWRFPFYSFLPFALHGRFQNEWNEFLGM